MAGDSQKLNEGELALYSMHLSSGYIPVGVDLAARVFQVCYLTEKQKIKNKALSREAFLDFLKSPPFSQPLMVGFEACGGCNYWARFIESLGHKYKIMPAASIRAFLGLQKTDKIDALAIFKGTICPSVRTIRARDEENQTLMNLLAAREQLLKQQTQSLNAQRAMLYELGEICGEGAAKIDAATDKLKESLEKSQSEAICNFRMIAEPFKANRDSLEAQIKQIDLYLKQYAKNNRTVQNLMTIPGIGVLSAVTLYAVLGNPDDFPNSRHFASFAGFAPRVFGSGGIVQVGMIPHTGNRQLKKILYMCAIARFAQQTRKASTETEASKLTQLIDNPEISNKKIVCSIANRLARVAWTIAKSGQPFDAKKCRLLG